MQIPCLIQSSILTTYVWILSNDLDFSEPNFVTKIPYFRFSKGPNKTCFLIRELQMRKIFHWHYVLTQIWYLEQEPKMGSSKNFCPLWRNYALWRNKVIWRYLVISRNTKLDEIFAEFRGISWSRITMERKAE